MADEPDWQRPSPKLSALRGTQVVTVSLIALVAGLGATLASHEPVAAIALAAAVFVAGGVGWVLVERRVRSWGYAERDADLLVRRGLLFRRLSIVPYGRMQFVDVSAGPFERLFGLATVRLHTAAAASDARIPGLDPPDAQRLRDALTSRGEAQSMGL